MDDFPTNNSADCQSINSDTAGIIINKPKTRAKRSWKRCPSCQHWKRVKEFNGTYCKECKNKQLKLIDSFIQGAF